MQNVAASFEILKHSSMEGLWWLLNLHCDPFNICG